MQNPANQLNALADLIKRRNDIDQQIAAIVKRPALTGHVGEYLAAAIFDITLENNATNAAWDGRFASGVLARRTVNVKWYPICEGLLDVAVRPGLDFYLVLTGPRREAISSRGSVRPWVIDRVYLFESGELLDELEARGVKCGVASSVTRATWDRAEIFPNARNQRLSLSDGQCEMLKLFSTARLDGTNAG